LPGSLGLLINSLQKSIEDSPGGTVLLATTATSLQAANCSEAAPCQLHVRTTGEQDRTLFADQVIFAINSKRALQIWDESFKLSDHVQWRADQYYRAFCVLLELPFSISNYYWNNIADERCFFTGYIEQTRLTGVQEYGGVHVGYLTKYVPPGDPSYSYSTREIRERAMDDLRILAPNLDPGDLLGIHVSIGQDAQVVTPMGYRPNRLGFCGNTKVGLVNISMTYPDERGIDQAIKLGKRMAQESLDSRQSIRLPVDSVVTHKGHA
jgi:protoporphyrinogen oxidase